MKLLLLIVMDFSFAMKADISSCEKAKLYFEYPSNGFISEGSKFKVVFGSKNIKISCKVIWRKGLKRTRWRNQGKKKKKER